MQDGRREQQMRGGHRERHELGVHTEQGGRRAMAQLALDAHKEVEGRTGLAPVVRGVRRVLGAHRVPAQEVPGARRAEADLGAPPRHAHTAGDHLRRGE